MAEGDFMPQVPLKSEGHPRMLQVIEFTYIIEIWPCRCAASSPYGVAKAPSLHPMVQPEPPCRRRSGTGDGCYLSAPPSAAAEIGRIQPDKGDSPSRADRGTERVETPWT